MARQGAGTPTASCAGGRWPGRTPGPGTGAIAAYLGRSALFDQAIGEFATAYADQNERDYHALARAVKAGRVVAERGV